MRKTLIVWLVATFLVCTGYLGWQYIGSDYVAGSHQRSLVERYGIEAADCVAPNNPSALLRIPEFGDKYVMPIVDSVDQDVLDSGAVGAYPGKPGTGNYALAAHRITHGEPFRNLPQLGKGDKVLVEQDCKVYTYTVTANFEVDMSDTTVLEDDGTKQITMVTCASLFHTDTRTVVKGTLTNVR